MYYIGWESTSLHTYWVEQNDNYVIDNTRNIGRRTKGQRSDRTDGVALGGQGGLLLEATSFLVQLMCEN